MGGRTARILAGAGALAWCCGAARGMWDRPPVAPVDRLVTNIGAYVEGHQFDAQGYYLLGRVHGLAFTKATDVVSVWGHRDERGLLPDVCSDDFQLTRRNDRGPLPKVDELLPHLAESLKNFEKAILLDGTRPEYHLGYAYVLEMGCVFAERVEFVPGRAREELAEESRREYEALVEGLKGDDGERRRALARLFEAGVAAAEVLAAHRDDADERVREGVREALAAIWREKAIEEYLVACEESIRKDVAIKTQPMRGLRTLVAYEAGLSYVKMVRARGTREDEGEKIERIERALAELDAKPRGGITPILFALDGARLRDLVSGRSAVFDLDGDGEAERWGWVRPRTGILVWDPEGAGRITSGRQLFGSVTWWMFFEDGYHALDALDDNRDGELAGAELAGIRVWFDRDGDGVSDAGELASLQSCGIAGIATRATTEEDGCAANLEGLRMADGRVVATYDWVSEPSAEIGGWGTAAAGVVILGACGMTSMVERRWSRARVSPRCKNGVAASFLLAVLQAEPGRS